MVVDVAKIDQFWSNSTLPRRYRMSTLDEINKEKQRISEALVRVDAQREKLSGQLTELEAAERVLGRYSKGTRARRNRLAQDAGQGNGRGRSSTIGSAQPHHNHEISSRRPRLAKSR